MKTVFYSLRFDAPPPTCRYWRPSERRYVRLRLSTMATKMVGRIGIEKAGVMIPAQSEKI